MYLVFYLRVASVYVCNILMKARKAKIQLPYMDVMD